jgi:hypothetical protein
MDKLSNWETRCHCNEYDFILGNISWCYFHKGPHPLARTLKTIRQWKKFRNIEGAGVMTLAQKIHDRLRRWYIEGLIGKILNDNEWERFKRGERFWI